jgi:hypothetical protein
MILPVIGATLCAIGALGRRVAGLRRPTRPGADRWRSYGWALVLVGLECRPASFGEERHDRRREVPVGPH